MMILKMLNITIKKYFHIGIAVDTPTWLMVQIRNVIIKILIIR